jgi:hypothetical protein
VVVDEWAVLAAHQPRSTLDEGSVHLLLVEQVLAGRSIDSVFDPCRPGEEVSAGYGSHPTIRLMVSSRDLTRAIDIVADLECSDTEVSDQDLWAEDE